jgi:hypothetical protein
MGANALLGKSLEGWQQQLLLAPYKAGGARAAAGCNGVIAMQRASQVSMSSCVAVYEYSCRASRGEVR